MIDLLLRVAIVAAVIALIGVLDSWHAALVSAAIALVALVILSPPKWLRRDSTRSH